VTHAWRYMAWHVGGKLQVCGRSSRDAPVCIRGHHALHGQLGQPPPLSVADGDHLKQVHAAGLPASIEALPGTPPAGLSRGWSGTARPPRVCVNEAEGHEGAHRSAFISSSGQPHPTKPATCAPGPRSLPLPVRSAAMRGNE